MAVIWYPHAEVHKAALESVQNRAIRWICVRRPWEGCSITSLCSGLQLLSLEERPYHQRMALMHKIVNGEVAVTPDELGLKRGIPAPEMSSLNFNSIYIYCHQASKLQ